MDYGDWYNYDRDTLADIPSRSAERFGESPALAMETARAPLSIKRAEAASMIRRLASRFFLSLTPSSSFTLSLRAPGHLTFAVRDLYIALVSAYLHSTMQGVIP